MPNQRRKPDAPPPPKSPPTKMSEARAKELAKKQSRVREASLRNLNIWEKGRSGNPSGKSKSLNEIMRLARSHAPEAIITLLGIMRNKSAADRDRIQAALALLDRGCGKAVVPVFRGNSNNLPDDMITGAGGEEATALIVAARAADGDYRRVLQDELHKLDAEENAERAASKVELDRAREAMRRGAPIDPALRMLIETKDALN